MHAVVKAASSLPYAVLAPHGPPVAATAASFAPGDVSVHFFLQLALILSCCLVMGKLCERYLGQPRVVGEMIAGVVLGPSLFGLLLPGAAAIVFPHATSNLLYAGGQLGVGLYMFLVGTSLRLDQLRSKVRVAALVSLAGIAVPFLLAIPVAPLLLRMPGLFAPSIGAPTAILFLGACIALTAFPMLARIVSERNLAGTALGTLSLTAGAIDDLCSWCILAVVLAIVDAAPGGAVLAIGGGIGWAILVALTVPRLFRALKPERRSDSTVIGLALTAFCLSAFLMDAIGVHAIFGGFIMGAAMPRGAVTETLRQRLEPLTIALLLPMFFTYSGLNTRLDLLLAPGLLLVALGILALAVLAKGGACYLAARIGGEDHRTAFGIGALMNARGLMELIIVNIGLQHGIIGPQLFSILVLMAIVTTMMASPLFVWGYGRGTPDQAARTQGEASC